MIKTTSNLPGRWCCCSLFSATLYSFFSIKIDFPWGSSSPKQSPKQIRQVLSPLSFHHPVDASNRGLCSYLSRSCSFSILELTNWSTLSFLVFSFWIWWKLQDYLIHQLGKAKPKVLSKWVENINSIRGKMSLVKLYSLKRLKVELFHLESFSAISTFDPLEK